MNPVTVLGVLAAAIALGTLIGLWAGCVIHSRTDQPPSRPGWVERMRIRYRRRREWSRARVEYVRTGTIRPVRINRVETW